MLDSILKRYTELTFNDVSLRDDGDGRGIYIDVWISDKPKPTMDQVNQWVFEDSKDIKKAELSAQCNAAITSGFTSSALGSAHTYPSDEEAQRNFNTTMNRFLTDANYATAYFKTMDAGYLPHTKDQFFKVFADGHDFGFAQIQKLNDLKAKVDPAATQADLDAITW